MRWATAPIRTRRSIPLTAFRASRVASLPIVASGSGAGRRQAGARAACSRICRRPTLISWSFRVQQEITRQYGADRRLRRLARISRTDRRRRQRTVSGDLSGCAVPGDLLQQVSPPASPARRCRREPTTCPPRSAPIPPSPTPGLTFSEGDSSYNALQVDLNHRFSHGLRAARRLHLVEDDRRRRFAERHNVGRRAGAGFESVQPPRRSRAWRTSMSGTWASINALAYAVRRFGQAHRGTNMLVSGWTINSIVTLQGGFPFTPQLSYNPSNNGDTRNPVRPFVNPAFTGPVILGESESVVQSGGVSGAAQRQRILRQPGRDTLIGPGLATWDLGPEGHAAERASQSAVSRGVVQCPEPRQFQYAERGHLYAHRSLAHGRRDHQHVDDFAPDSVRIEAALVSG